MTERVCKDCPEAPPSKRRPAPNPGPRCATHHREVKRARSKAAHDRRLTQVYTGIKAGDYDRIVEAQGGGLCPICLRAKIKGRKRRAALEHDHLHDWPRGIVCWRCNDYIAWILDDPEAGDRLADYLRNPPAHKVLGPPPGKVLPSPQLQ